MTALEQAAAVRSRQVSPVELVEHYLDRMERARRGAGRVRHGHRRGRAGPGQEGRGQLSRRTRRRCRRCSGCRPRSRTSTSPPACGRRFGSTLFADFVPPVDDNVVTLLRRAGTISLGKTNTPEFGLPCYTENGVAPPARTPWDTTRSPAAPAGRRGGGRGGPGAVRAGQRRRWLGPDPGQRLRPVRDQGRPRPGQQRPDRRRRDRAGLERSAGPQRPGRRGDCWTRWPVPMPGDPHWAPPLPAADVPRYAGRDPGTLRIGRYATPVVEGAEVHPDCLAAYERRRGARRPRPRGRGGVAPFGPEAIACSSGVGLSGPPRRSPPREAELRPLTRELRDRGLAMSGAGLVDAMPRCGCSPGGLTATAQYDVVLTPDADQPPGRWAGSTRTATPPRTSSGRSATPRSPRCSTSPGSPR